MTTDAPDVLPFDAVNRCLIRTETVHLTPTEWHLFQFLWQHRRVPVPVERLYNLIWANSRSSPDHRILSVYMNRLRHKLDGTGWRIASNVGRGIEDRTYCLQPEGTPDRSWLRDFYGRRKSQMNRFVAACILPVMLAACTTSPTANTIDGALYGAAMGAGNI